MILEEELAKITEVSNGFKPMAHLADSLADMRTEKELEELAYDLYLSDVYQIRMVVVFIFGKVASKSSDVLNFLKKNVSKDEN